MIYTFNLTVYSKNRTPKIFNVDVDIEYNDKNFYLMENKVRDTVVDLANKFIDSEFYG